MTDIQELLDCDDLRKHKAVIEAYDCLVAKGKWQHRYVKRCGFRDVTCEKCQHTVQCAWHEMNDFDPPHDCSVPSTPIPGSLADVAEAMRDAVVKRYPDKGILWGMWDILSYKDENTMNVYAYIAEHSTCEERIIAAVLAWKEQEK